MTNAASPRERVERYIAEWEPMWSGAVAKLGEKVDFGAWAELLRTFDARHFVGGAGSGLERTYSPTIPEHDPATERVIAVDEHDDRARVETVREELLIEYLEYELRRERGDWRILSVVQFRVPAGMPLVPEDARAVLLAGATADAPLRSLEGPAPAATTLFEDGRSVAIGGKVIPLSVRRLGALRLRSGVLGALDFSDEVHRLSPLARRVEPGNFPVEVLLAQERVAAVRVLLSPDAEVARWCAAEFAGGGHRVAVDAANVAIFDLASFASLEARAKERLYRRFVASAEKRPIARMLTLEAEDDCALVESGWGDGNYRCYWGVDEAGRPAMLLIDFFG